jgi:hypothetical protein
MNFALQRTIMTLTCGHIERPKIYVTSLPAALNWWFAYLNRIVRLWTVSLKGGLKGLNKINWFLLDSIHINVPQKGFFIWLSHIGLQCWSKSWWVEGKVCLLWAYWHLIWTAKSDRFGRRSMYYKYDSTWYGPQMPDIVNRQQLSANHLIISAASNHFA